MANDNNIPSFTAFDIEKYHKGLLTSKERHALEKAALDDPFLADALEGYTAEVNVAADLAELKQRLASATTTAKVIPIGTAKGSGSSFRLLRIAAIIIVVLGAGFMAYQFAFTKKDNTGLAKNEPQEQTPTTTQNNTGTTTTETKADSGRSTTATSNPAVKQEGTKGNASTTITIQPGTATTQGNRQEDKITQEVSSPVIGETTEKKENRRDQVAVTTTAPAKALEYDKEALSKKRKDADDTKEAESLARQDKYEQNNRARVSAPVATNNSNRAFSNQNDNSYYRNMNTFRGRVLDASNNGVPFANVTNVQDNVGTYTDAKGYFNLTSTDSILNVQVRSVGLENRNVELQNSLNNNQIVLQEDQSVATQTISTKKINAEKRQLTSTMKLQEPEPVDGWENYDSYLSNNLNVPDDFKTKQTGSGQVEVSFEVNKYGEPVNFKVEKSLCGRCDQEAIRLIKEGPKWKRKAKKGRTTVTISF